MGKRLKKNKLLKERMKYLVKIGLLAIICMAIAIGGRIYEGNHIRIVHEMDVENVPLNPQKLEVEWEPADGDENRDDEYENPESTAYDSQPEANDNTSGRKAADDNDRNPGSGLKAAGELDKNPEAGSTAYAAAQNETGLLTDSNNEYGMEEENTDKGLEIDEITIQDDNKLVIDMHPNDPGDYNLTILDEDGEVVHTDEMHVDELKTTFSSYAKSFTGDVTFIGSLTLFILGLALLNIRQFFRLKGSMMYSYDAILTCGLGIFCLVTGAGFIRLFFMHLLWPEVFGSKSAYELLIQSGGPFMIITFPLVLLFSLMMILSNIELLRHERFRIQNILGLAIGAVLILSEMLGFFLLTMKAPGSAQGIRLYYTITNIYLTIFTYFECILLGSVISGFRAARHVPEPEQDYILILGCRFRKDGTLTPLLASRVDKAIAFWKMQKEKTGRQAILLPSGGQGPDESMPEAEAMGRYLREQGIPDEAILQEDQSKNTYQNMKFSYKLIQEKENAVRMSDSSSESKGGKRSKDNKSNIIFVTTNYHVFRSGVWAGLAGLQAEGLGSGTKWWFWPNAFIREVIGLLANRLRNEILGLVFLVVIFGAISLWIV